MAIASTTPQAESDAGRRGALEGLRVLEVATMVAAPIAGMMLADLGAEVIKVELPGKADPLRSWGYRKNGIPLYWKVVSRNKRAITLDLHKPRGRELLLQLIAASDVLIENFRPGTLDAWDLGSHVLRRAKPDLVVLRISGFGHTGPNSRRAGFGTVAEAMSGFAYTNGWPDRPPALPSFSMADALAGITGAYGVLAALRYRDHTGKGQDIDIALYEPLLTLLGSLVIDYDQLGVVNERSGNAISFVAPRNAYLTSDGKWFALSAAAQAVAERLFQAIGHPELIADERYCTNERRVENVATLDKIIGGWAVERTLDDVLATLEGNGVPAGPIYSAADIYMDAHMRARGSIVQVNDPELGCVVMQAPVPRLTATPGTIKFTGRMQPGHDNDDVYGDLLELPEDELARLADQGVI